MYNSFIRFGTKLYRQIYPSVILQFPLKLKINGTIMLFCPFLDFDVGVPRMECTYLSLLEHLLT